MGLMQIMPKTYAGLRARHHLGPDAYNPRDNILAGAAYLREILDGYGPEGFLATYNAGPAATTSIWRPAGRCRRRRRSMSRCSHP
jgi:soluble lytic murein transglycosylase-like protein